MDDENTTFKERDIPENPRKPEDLKVDSSLRYDFGLIIFALELGKRKPRKEK